MASGTRNMVAGDAQPDDQPTELAALREENARLRAELAKAGKSAEAERAGLREAAKSTPREVSGVHVPDEVFLSEGLRADLAREGRAIDPMTGIKLGGPWPAEDKQ